MNLGVERFLILGCIAVLILEAPSLMADLTRGDGSAAVLAQSSVQVAPLVAEVVPPEAQPQPAVELAAVEPGAPVVVLANLLPDQPGL
ncbi:MAG: hypothetical protein P1V81_06120 [Planctomycetota bacterium]|nr:hypothetical protein [Planctomycetota bacterium]